MPKVVPMQSSQETFQEGKKWRKIDNVVHKPKNCQQDIENPCLANIFVL